LRNQVQLITYVDRLSGGGLAALSALLEGRLKDVFGGVHLLPFFDPIDGSDAGFDPKDHTRVDPRLGDWSDMRALSANFDVMADMIVNHVSADSPQFRDYLGRGDASPYAGMFLTLDRVFPAGAREADLTRIYRPRPGLPFTAATLSTGEKRLLWTTFTPSQIDIDVEHPAGAAYLDAILEKFREAGIGSIRLDAAGYAIKKAGTSCFMIPETYAFIARLAEKARAAGIEVLVEIHSHYQQQIEIAKRVDRVYDFALPPLVLDALFRQTSKHLKDWLKIGPRNAITVLDTHDGIGVIDVGQGPAGEPGLLPPEAIDALVETIHTRSKGHSRKATGAAASNLDLYQVNCTFFDALGGRDTEYLIARAVQFFAPGIPQVYYVGLLAGANDMDLLTRTAVGRDINRHYYQTAEIDAALHRPVVQRLIELIRLRNAHPAFSGALEVERSPDTALSLVWKHDEDWAHLEVNFTTMDAAVHYSTPEGARTLKLK